MSMPIRVLCVEDSPDDAELLLHALRDGGYDPTCVRVETAAAMTAALAQPPWDLIISDYALPQFDALAALALLQESGLDLPLIIVSGVIGEDTAVAAMKAGAHDYIMMNKLARLLPAVARELREAVERRERRRAEEALRESEARYALVARAVNDGLWGWHLPSHTIYFSRAGKRCSAMKSTRLAAVRKHGSAVCIPMTLDWCKRASPPMYRAKAPGRARYEVFDTAMYPRAVPHLEAVGEHRCTAGIPHALPAYGIGCKL